MRLLTPVDLLILSEVDKRGELRSIFRLAVEHLINYEHARARIARLERAGLLTTARLLNARGRPFVVTRAPNAPRQSVFEWPLHDCNGATGGHDGKT